MNIDTIATADLTAVSRTELVNFLNTGDNRKNIEVLGAVSSELIRRHAQECEDIEECGFNPIPYL